MKQGGWGSSAGANLEELVRRESEGHGPVFTKDMNSLCGHVCVCMCVHVCMDIYVCGMCACMHWSGSMCTLSHIVKGTRLLAVVTRRSGGGNFTATSVIFFLLWHRQKHYICNKIQTWKSRC